MSELRTFRISPSDFAGSYKWCKRCWYKRLHGLYAPREAMPKTFTHVDSSMKGGITAETLTALGMPTKAFLTVEKVLSTPIEFPELGVSLVIGGKLDKCLELMDETFGVTDYKMTQPSALKVGDYRPQLHSYGWCLQNPAQGTPREITRMSLVCWDASRGSFAVGAWIDEEKAFQAAQKGFLSLHEVEIDWAWFMTVLEEAARVAASPTMPDAGQSCETCNHVNDVVRDQIQREKVSA